MENKSSVEKISKKLMEDLAVLDLEKSHAIDLPQYEKLSNEEKLYSIRHPESKKNVRVIYTITEKNLRLFCWLPFWKRMTVIIKRQFELQGKD